MYKIIIEVATIIGITISALLWIQSTFVQASDFDFYQYRQVEDKINYLEDKKKRLEDVDKNLNYEDQRDLDRKRLDLIRLREKLKD